MIHTTYQTEHGNDPHLSAIKDWRDRTFLTRTTDAFNKFAETAVCKEHGNQCRAPVSFSASQNRSGYDVYDCCCYDFKDAVGLLAAEALRNKSSDPGISQV